MDWYKQHVGYYLEPEMIDAGEEAEILHLRAKSYSAQTGSHGYVPARALPMITPLRSRQRAERLVAVGLWLAVDGGYLIADWDEEQADLEALEARREADRDRKRAQRLREQRPPQHHAQSRDDSAHPSRDCHVTGGVTGHGTDLSVREKSKRREEPNYSSSSAGADDGPSDPPKRRKTRTPPPRFDEFWAAYPRRVGKIHAEKAYAKAVAAGADHDQLIAAARFYAMEKKLTDPQYIKHPATWLNGGCWQDEPDPVYKPPVITGPSPAATAMPRPYAQVRADQLAYGSPRPDADPWPDLGFGRIPA